MEFKSYVRKPFTVEAVQITKDNIEELAKFIGDLQFENGRPYILVDRRLVPNVVRVFPGYWFTRMGDHTRCYTKKIFAQQFTPNSDKLQTMVDFISLGGVESSRVETD